MGSSLLGAVGGLWRLVGEKKINIADNGQEGLQISCIVVSCSQVHDHEIISVTNRFFNKRSIGMVKKIQAYSDGYADLKEVRMNVQLTGHHVEVTPAIREHLVEKLERVKHHFDHAVDGVLCLLAALGENPEAARLATEIEAKLFMIVDETR